MKFSFLDDLGNLIALLLVCSQVYHIYLEYKNQQRKVSLEIPSLEYVK